MKIYHSLSSLSCLVLTSALLFVPQVNANEFEISNRIGIEQRLFTDDALLPTQLETSQTSVLFEPEIYWSWDSAHSVIFKPFVRYDAQDDERTHFDIREFSHIYASDNWEIRSGIRKVYWGVTEFQHLVDVINQTDAVDSFDGEEKLGQLMVNLSLVKDWGIVDLYVLPGLRERTFAGEKGRLRIPYVVNTEHVTYESEDEDQHVDFAARWTHTIGDMDIGAAWFHGTNREPLLIPAIDGDEVVLRQYYQQMDQISFDAQLIVEDWLWKLEAINRYTENDDFVALQTGFEVSFYGVYDSNADLGLLMEYGWDSRDKEDTTSVFQNDILIGTRLAFNDVQSTELLAGLGYDLDYQSTSFLVEANRRIGDSFTASLDLRLFSTDDIDDPLMALEQDDHIQFSLEWFF